MPTEESDREVIFNSAAAAIAAAVSGIRLGAEGHSHWVERPYPQIGDSVRVRLSVAKGGADRRHEWTLDVASAGVSDKSALTTAQPEVAIASFVWADRMLRTRFDELQDLLASGAVPRCVNSCGDLHNFLDWNLAGDAEELIRAGERVSLERAASPMEWPCTILNAVDGVIDVWLSLHAEPLLAADATAGQMAGLLCCHNARIEEQVAERFIAFDHRQTVGFLKLAAGSDGSNLPSKVMALVNAAYRAGRKNQ